MTLTFLGTRGEIEARSRLHYRHSALLVSHRNRRVLIDCGSDWLDRFQCYRPDAIVLTHAHVDHIGGLKNGASCPVFATAETWRGLRRFPIAQHRVIQPRAQVKICGMRFQAFALEHSVIAPAVGWRVAAGRARFFYAPDVVSIHQAGEALARIGIYIGDGATIVRPLLRRRGSHFIGHASVRQQLDWCEQYKVHRAIFTHCGSAVVTADHAAVNEKVRTMAKERSVSARIAHDGMTIRLP